MNKSVETPNTPTPEAILQALQAQAASFQKEVQESVEYAGIEAREAFIDLLYAHMVERRVSRAELARRLGTSRAYVSKVLGGGENLTMDTMARLASAIGCVLRFDLCDRSVSDQKFIRPEQLTAQNTIASSRQVMYLLRGGFTNNAPQTNPERTQRPTLPPFALDKAA